MKIAIIGAGVSGLVAAHHLCRDHDVTVFEANSYVGGHVNTVDVQDADRSIAIDTGFIVFNDWTYPNFIKLLDQLGVASNPSEMSFSVKDPKSGLEYNGHSLDTIFAQRRNLFRPSFLRMIRDILRFNKQAKIVARSENDTRTVGQFLADNGYCSMFASHYLLPMGASIWSCPTGCFADFPIQFIAEFYDNHGLLNVKDRPQWRVISGGSKTYVRELVRPFESAIQLDSPVVSVVRTDDAVQLFLASHGSAKFDHVVFACHADTALKILDAHSTVIEREVLGAFPYSRNTAVLHTDISLLPRRRRAWASWNYSLIGDDNSAATLTYNMNLLQGIESQETYCVTLNSDAIIDPEKILGRFEYSHPVFTLQRSAAQARHHELIGPNRTSFCGAYWRNGFHEDGVVSAIAVAERLEQLHHAEASFVTGGAQ